MHRRFAVFLVWALATGMVSPLLVASQAEAAPVLPSGFRLIDYPTAQAASSLANFFFTADGGLLATGRDGRVTFTPPGGASYEVGVVPSVRVASNHGMLGLAARNDYAVSGRFYVLYPRYNATRDAAYGVVEEWQASPPSRPTSMSAIRLVMDGSATTPLLTAQTLNHGVDSVVVAPDDSLFVSIGDDSENIVNAAGLRAQDLNDPHGKILHILPDGRGAPSNPFYDAADPGSWRSRVYAFGFRNPYRFTIDPRSGQLYVGDVGLDTVEEIDLVTAGGNYGWPCFEGTAKTGYSTTVTCQQLYARPDQPSPPLWGYTHAAVGGGAAIVGGIFYQGSSYPSSYSGSYFFGDYVTQNLWTMATSAAGSVLRNPEAGGFATNASAPVAFGVGPNGDIAYADIATGTVRRLVYQAGNRAPTAVFTTTTDPATLTVHFSAADSYDLDGDQLTYAWDLGDGTTASGVTATHAYAGPGGYAVRLTVTDQLGATGTSTQNIRPDNHSPTLTLTAPPPDATFAVGGIVDLSATGTDVEDGALPVTWTTALLHCPTAGGCHLHPDATATGNSFSTPFTSHGADTTMLITASVVDGVGAKAQATYEAAPRLRRLSVQGPVPIGINGTPQISADVVVGSLTSVEAPTALSYWSFVRWSDGGGRVHEITMPDNDVSLTATYETAIAVKYGQLGGTSSVLGAPTTPEYDVAGGRARHYEHGRIYWAAATGAKLVRGAILTKYAAIGGPARFGFPTTDEIAVTGGRASYFQTGRVYWSSATGAHAMWGSILTKYLAVGGPSGYGLPLNDETGTPDGVGRYNHFSPGNRSIYWTQAIGAHETHGMIRSRWASMGWERSCLGYPRTDEMAFSGGAISYFQRGWIKWWKATNTTTVYCA